MHHNLSHSLSWKGHWKIVFWPMLILAQMVPSLTGNWPGQWSWLKYIFFQLDNFYRQMIFQLDKSHGCGSLCKWMRVSWVGRGEKQPYLSCLVQSLACQVHKAGTELLKAAVDIAGSELWQWHDETKTWVRKCCRSLTSFSHDAAAAQFPFQVRQCSSVASREEVFRIP